MERAKEYFDGISESPTACAMKHFPGDGMDERDQHVVTSYNTLGYEEWNRTYGHVYREMIGHGVQSIMIGHIGRRSCPGTSAPAWRTRTSCPPPSRRNCSRTCSAASWASTG
ncbi:glycoside hydrolase family 3 N-terminal domain-containing protein [Arthrobacter sp. OVS8]|nr:glycoside hydrolase family 3 N-terminal domain-containing protein [Arthrobacter sp. OVS8]